MMTQSLAKLANKCPALLGQITYEFLNEGNTVQALKTLKRYQKKYPEDTSGLLLKGMIQEELGEYEEAKDIYHQVIEIDPRNLKALTRLAEIQRLETPNEDSWRKELLTYDPLSALPYSSVAKEREETEIASTLAESEKDILTVAGEEPSQIEDSERTAETILEPETAAETELESEAEADTEPVTELETEDTPESDEIVLDFDKLEKELENAMSGEEVEGESEDVTTAEDRLEESEPLDTAKPELESAQDETLETLEEPETAALESEPAVEDITLEEEPPEDTIEPEEVTEPEFEAEQKDAELEPVSDFKEEEAAPEIQEVEDSEIIQAEPPPETPPLKRQTAAPTVEKPVPDFTDVFIDSIPETAEPEAEDSTLEEADSVVPDIEVEETLAEKSVDVRSAATAEEIDYAAELEGFPLSEEKEADTAVEESTSDTQKPETPQMAGPVIEETTLGEDIVQPSETALLAEKVTEADTSQGGIEELASPQEPSGEKEIDTVLEELSALGDKESVRSLNEVEESRRGQIPDKEPAKKVWDAFPPPLEEVKISLPPKPDETEAVKAQAPSLEIPDIEELNKVFQEVNEGFDRVSTPPARKSPAEIRTTTLAEIYAKQGDYKKALEVYNALPEEEKMRHSERIRELQMKFP